MRWKIIIKVRCSHMCICIFLYAFVNNFMKLNYLFPISRCTHRRRCRIISRKRNTCSTELAHFVFIYNIKLNFRRHSRSIIMIYVRCSAAAPRWGCSRRDSSLVRTWWQRGEVRGVREDVGGSWEVSDAGNKAGNISHLASNERAPK